MAGGRKKVGGTVPTAGVALDGLDFHAPDFMADPYPAYARLRSAAALHYHADLGAFLAMRHADVVTILTDPRFVKEPLDGGPPPLRVMANMLDMDPPDHTRLRALVNRAFTPPVVERLRDQIAAIAAGLLDRAAVCGRFDLVADFAGPLCATVIAQLLGVPPEDHARFREWAERTILLTDATQPRSVLAEGRRAVGELVFYFTDLASARPPRLTDDFLGGLLAAREQGDRLSLREVVVMCALLLVAGHETATNLLATGTLTLLRNPDQLAALRARPDMMRTAVEELLRYESPVQRSGRFVAEDLELGGVRLRRGQRVAPMLGAANRDPAAFVDPERLDLGRRDNHHVAYGRGIHFCLGAPLARLEAMISFAALLDRFPRLALDTEKPEWNANTAIRGLKALPVRAAG
jgi:cytochrome P450